MTLLPTSASEWCLKLIALMLMAGSGTAAFWLGRSAQKLGPPNEGLTVPAEDLDIGDVWENKDFHCVLRLANRSDSDIEITGFTASCTCLSVEPAKLVIPVRQQRIIKLSLDLRPPPASGTTPRSRPVAIVLKPRIRGAVPRQDGWVIHGNVRSPLELNNRTILFGDELVVGQRFPTKQIRITANTPLARLTALSPKSLASVRITSPRRQSKIFILRLTPDRRLPGGPFMFELTLIAVDKDGIELPAISLRVQGVVRDDIEIVPADVALGAAPMGTVLQETITLRWERSGKNCTIQSMEASTQDSQIKPVGAPGGTERAFRLSQTVSKAGNQAETVRFVVRRQEGTLKTMTLHVSYYGVIK